MKEKKTQMRDSKEKEELEAQIEHRRRDAGGSEKPAGLTRCHCQKGASHNNLGERHDYRSSYKSCCESSDRGTAEGLGDLFSQKVLNSWTMVNLEARKPTALGYQRFRAIDQVDDVGLSIECEFHSDRWGDLGYISGSP